MSLQCPEVGCHVHASTELALAAHLIDAHRFPPQMAADIARVVVRFTRRSLETC